MEMKALVTITDQKAVTTSQIIAEAFEKHHKNILRDIERLECSNEFTELNFEPSSYKDSTGRILPCYNITRDGFTFLAMGFTGKKAAQFKEAFIAAFNRMEQALLDGSGEVKRFDFTHHRGSGQEMTFTLSVLKDLPPVARMMAIEELTGRDMSRTLKALKSPAPQRDEELARMEKILAAMVDGGYAESYGFKEGHDGNDCYFFEGNPQDVGAALAEVAGECDLTEMLDNKSRFHARFRDKALLKKIGWKREINGFMSWQVARFTKVAG